MAAYFAELDFLVCDICVCGTGVVGVYLAGVADAACVGVDGTGVWVCGGGRGV